MNEKLGTGVNSGKEKVEESQSRSVTPSLDTPSGAGLGRHTLLSSILIPIFLPYMHLFIHVIIYSYHLRIPVMSLSIHILPIFLSYIHLFIYVFTIHLRIHYS